VGGGGEREEEEVGEEEEEREEEEDGVAVQCLSESDNRHKIAPCGRRSVVLLRNFAVARRSHKGIVNHSASDGGSQSGGGGANAKHSWQESQ